MTTRPRRATGVWHKDANKGRRLTIGAPHLPPASTGKEGENTVVCRNTRARVLKSVGRPKHMSWESIETGQMQRQSRVERVGVFRLDNGVPFQQAAFAFNTGRASVPLGRSRVQPIGAVTDDENQPLIKDNRRPPMQTFGVTTAVIICSGVMLWALLILLVTTLYWNFTASMNVANAEFRPQIQAAINHTMSILAHTDAATSGAHGILDGAHDLTNQALPAIERALNQSAAMVDRLERLAQNPVLQISLQNGAGGVGR